MAFDGSLSYGAFDLAIDIAYELYPTKDILDSAAITTPRQQQEFLSILDDYFDLKEMEIFYHFLIGDKNKIIKSKKKPSFTLPKLKKRIATFLSETTLDVNRVTRLIGFTLQTEDVSTPKELLLIIKDALDE